MNKRWYASFQCIGHRDQLLDKIERVVRNHDLAETFPAISFERESGKRGEYYLFLAVEGVKFGELPSDISLIQAISQIRTYVGPTPPDSIKDMSSRELDVQGATKRIPYRAPIADEDPFSVPDDHGAVDSDDRPPQNEPEAHDRLLVWLSATGTGSLRTLSSTAVRLGLPAGSAQRLVRGYKLLGHMETADNGYWWSAAPATIVRAGYSEGGPAFFLAGQRDDSLLELLQLLIDLRRLPQQGGGPTLVELVGAEEEAIEQIAEDSGGRFDYSGAVAQRLVEELPTVAEWTASLRTLAGVSPEMYRLKRFNGKEFVETSVFTGETGFYELVPSSSGHGPRSRSLTVFYDSVGGRWLRGEWYGLRFLAHRAHGEVGSPQYDRSTGRFAVHASWRFPELFERALVLSSGQLPSWTSGWLVYESVDHEVAEVLCSKLDMELEERIVHA